MTTQWQRYDSPAAYERMAAGRCPECGKPPGDHTGWGTGACSLTDTGVAGRIEQYRRDLEACLIPRHGGAPPRDYCDDLADVGKGATNVLMAVLADRVPTYGSIMQRTGYSRATVAHHLQALRRTGFVTWEDGKRGTIRPTVSIVMGWAS